MKKNYLFWTMALGMTMSMASCSSDEANNGEPTLDGDTAYITVRLCDAGTASRATAGGFEYGVEEQKVQNCHMYFYDAAGNYVTEAAVWNDGNAATGTPGNIEFTSNTVVPLRGLTGNTYPEYMVTVVNRPSNFVPGRTLADMEKVLTENVCYTSGKDVYFTMSTTSYKQTGLNYSFVNKLVPANFSKEPVPAENPGDYTTPISVYVERLAAKVKVNVGSNFTNAETVNGKTLYKIAQVAVAQGVGQSAPTDLYIQFDGWKLNATAKQSYVIKNIDATWADSYAGITWNDAANHRSYWGKSFNYGDNTKTYPSVISGVKDTDALDYVNVENMNTFTEVEYCAENTNTAEIVGANYPNAVTGVVVKATICDANGNALDLVRHNGLLFKKADFINYVLNVLDTQDKLEYYSFTGSEYAQVDASYFKLVNLGDGFVKVQFDATGKGDVYELKNSTYTKTTNFTALQGNLAAISVTGSERVTSAYTGGLTYYYIPIEHLNENTTEGIQEGEYGVVRNHYYNVTINSISNIGKGVFDPAEDIVPSDKETMYYIGANVNILSWKIVNQNADL